MIKNLIAISLTIVCISYSCKENYQEQIADTIININPKDADNEINLSLFIDSIEYIKLQTVPSHSLGYVPLLYVKEKYIYALDLCNQTVFVFDKDGQYISKLDKQGQGPDEYINLMPLIIDDEEKYISMSTLSSRGNNLLKYSNISFDLIDEHPMPELDASHHRLKDKIHYFIMSQIPYFNDEEREENSELIIVKDGRVVKTLFEYATEENYTNYQYFIPNIESFAENDNDELFVSIMYQNTFFRLKGLNVDPYITIDFGRHGIDNSIRHKSLNDQQRYLERIKGKAGFPVLSINNSNIMVFSYYFFNNGRHNLFEEDDFHQYIDLKNSNRIFHTKRVRNDITHFPEFVNLSAYNHEMAHTPWYKNYLIDVVIPSEVIPADKNSIYVEGIGEISIDDNPIIVLMRLKEDI